MQARRAGRRRDARGGPGVGDDARRRCGRRATTRRRCATASRPSASGSTSRAAICEPKPTRARRSRTRPPTRSPTARRRSRRSRRDRAAARGGRWPPRAPSASASPNARGAPARAGRHEARLRSLEELEASRATFGDAARFLLAEPAPIVAPARRVADHLEVERSYERAVDALLGDLLQHVIVETHRRRRRGARALSPSATPAAAASWCSTKRAPTAAARPRRSSCRRARARCSSVVRASRAARRARLRALVGDALDRRLVRRGARRSPRHVSVPVATLSGEVFRGAHGSSKAARAATRAAFSRRAREMHDASRRGRRGAGRRGDAIGDESSPRSTLDDRGRRGRRSSRSVDAQHEQEKAIVGSEGRLSRTTEDRARVTRRLDVVATERARAEEEQRRGRAAPRRGRRRDRRARDAAARRPRRVSARVLARLHAAREDAEGALRLVTEARTGRPPRRARGGARHRRRAPRGGRARARGAHRQRARRDRAEREVTRARSSRASIAETERLLDEDVARARGAQDEMRALDERVAICARSSARASTRFAAPATRSSASVARSCSPKWRARHAASDLAHLAAACLEPSAARSTRSSPRSRGWSRPASSSRPRAGSPHVADAATTTRRATPSGADAGADGAGDARRAIAAASATPTTAPLEPRGRSSPTCGRRSSASARST